MVQDELTGIPLFAGISDESAALVAGGTVAEVPAGQVLMRGGDHGEGMVVVLSGTVVVERGDLHIGIGPGGFFGELALLADDAVHIARVRAQTDARVIAVPRETFDHLVDHEPTFARALLTELAARLIAARTGT
jgi:CRP-like cAMP-binding protein